MPGSLEAGVSPPAAVWPRVCRNVDERAVGLDHGVHPIGDVDRADGLYQELVHASVHRLDDPAAFRIGGDHNDGKEAVRDFGRAPDLAAELGSVATAELEVNEIKIDLAARDGAHCLIAVRGFFHPPHAEADKDSPQHPAHMRVGVQDERAHAFQSHTHDVLRSPVADDCLFHPCDRPFPRFAAPRRFTLAVEDRRFIGHDTINRC